MLFGKFAGTSFHIGNYASFMIQKNVCLSVQHGGFCHRLAMIINRFLDLWMHEKNNMKDPWDWYITLKKTSFNIKTLQM